MVDYLSSDFKPSERLIYIDSKYPNYKVLINNYDEAQQFWKLRDTKFKNEKIKWDYSPKIMSLDELEKKLDHENFKHELKEKKIDYENFKKVLKDELLNELQK